MAVFFPLPTDLVCSAICLLFTVSLSPLLFLRVGWCFGQLLHLPLIHPLSMCVCVCVCVFVCVCVCVCPQPPYLAVCVESRQCSVQHAAADLWVSVVQSVRHEEQEERSALRLVQGLGHLIQRQC